MKRILMSAAIAIAAPLAAMAGDLVTKSSSHDVATTVDRLAAAVEDAGAKVFARVDHAAGAAKIGQDLRPTQMLMFGNPKLGTPVMQMSQSAGLDLPTRVVVYETEDGEVVLAYHPPRAMGEAHDLPADAEALKKMTGAVDKLTSKAVSE